MSILNKSNKNDYFDIAILLIVFSRPDLTKKLIESLNILKVQFIIY